MIYNKSTKKFNKLKTAVKNGIFENPENFIIPEGKILVKSKNDKPLLTNAKNYKKYSNFDSKINNHVLINTTGRILKNTEDNRQKISQNINKSFIGKFETKYDNAYEDGELFDWLKDKSTGNDVLLILKNDKLLAELYINKNIDRWWKINKYTIIDNSDGTYKYENATYILSRKTNYIPKNKIIQSYADGDSHCVINPILNWVQYKQETSKNNKIYSSLNKKLNILLEKYTDENGFPIKMNLEQIQVEIVDKLNINITIKDLFFNDIINLKTDKSLTTIKYVNSKINHLEMITSTNQETLVCNEELLDIINYHRENRLPHFVEGSINTPYKLITSNKMYKLDDQDNEIIKDFNKKNQINKFKLFKKKDELLYNFIRKGANYNAHCSYIEKAKNLSTLGLFEEDLKNAYTQYKNNKYYKGFPTIMSPVIKLNNAIIFDKENKKYIEKFNGYYRVELLEVNNENVKNHLNKLGLCINNEYILTNIEILSLIDYDCVFKCFNLSISCKSIDLNIDELLDENRYRKWAGKLHFQNDTTILSTYGDDELINHISETIPREWLNLTDFDENRNSKIITITRPNDNVSCLSHIGGFITSYTRTKVFEQLFKLDVERIVGFKLDGFTYAGNQIPSNELDECWHTDIRKPAKVNFDWNEKIFENIKENENLDDDKSFVGEEIIELIENQYTYFTGPGGCGKTTYVGNRISKHTIYTSRQWVIASNAMKEFGFEAFSVNKMIGEKCDSYITKYNHPFCIFVDERNQIDEKWITKLVKLYPYSVIICACDIDDDFFYYQCDFENVNVNIDKSKWKIKHFNTNYRCLDSDLLQLLFTLRKFMKKGGNTKQQVEWVKKVFNNKHFIDENHLKHLYDYKKDWLLISTRNDENCKDNISEATHFSNLLQGNKYVCRSKTTIEKVLAKINGDNSILLNGEIIVDPTEEQLKKNKMEKTDGFTIHSIQGKTIEDKIFISLKSIFCIRQIYTAISRARYLDQIYFIV